jgi:hypothetical protein
VNKYADLEKRSKKTEDKQPKRQNPAEKPVSLAPLSFEQAIGGLLAIKSEVTGGRVKRTSATFNKERSNG